MHNCNLNAKQQLYFYLTFAQLGLFYIRLWYKNDYNVSSTFGQLRGSLLIVWKFRNLLLRLNHSNVQLHKLKPKKNQC